MTCAPVWPMLHTTDGIGWFDSEDGVRRLIDIGLALRTEQNLSALLEQILREARRFTRAEAGTLFLRDGDLLRFASVQNDRLARDLGARAMRRLLEDTPLKIHDSSLAAYVAITGEVINVPDAEMIPSDLPYVFNGRVDERTGYRTRSVLAAPLEDADCNIFGVLQLLNARDDLGCIVPFDLELEALVRPLTSLASVAIMRARRRVECG